MVTEQPRASTVPPDKVESAVHYLQCVHRAEIVEVQTRLFDDQIDLLIRKKQGRHAGPKQGGRNE